MSARVYSAAVVGIQAVAVEVEVDVLKAGLHNFTLVGLPDQAIRESRDRVSAALKNSGFRPPHQSGRITVNLAPADLPKISPIYDVPIALGLLLATGQTAFVPEGKVFIGEMALDGAIRRVNGVLPIALYAKEIGIQEIYVPEDNKEEAALVPGLAVYPIRSLQELVSHLTAQKVISPFVLQNENRDEDRGLETDMAHIQGQEHAKRALEIAAAGGHNLLFVGPPGSGKTLLARALPSILPAMNFEESLEVMKIASVAGKSTKNTLIRLRPFRAPHHSASAVSLIGGGSFPRPGEISLAHRGVLFLDEFAEFPRAVLESLRQPLEEGSVTVARARGALHFPARFMLVAAMNPCPCGYAGDLERLCSCPPYQAVRYRQKISGPLLDRIDLHVDVPRQKIEKIQDTVPQEASVLVRKRVELARQRQLARFVNERIFTNAEMSGEQVKRLCLLEEEGKAMLRLAVDRLSLSARGYMRILKVARTIADIEGSENILPGHIGEALQYRFND